MKLAIISNHPLVRKTLTRMVQQAGHEVAYEGIGSTNMVAAVRRSAADMALVDVPGTELADIAAGLSELRSEGIRVFGVALQGLRQPPSPDKLVQAGFSSFVALDGDEGRLVRSLEAAEGGASVFVVPGIDAPLSTIRAGPEVLDQEEKALICYLRNGLRYEEIAEEMHRGKRWVSDHVSKLMRELEVETLFQLGAETANWDVSSPDAER